MHKNLWAFESKNKKTAHAVVAYEDDQVRR